MIRIVSLRLKGQKLIPFGMAAELQRILIEYRAADRMPDTFLLLEHPSVITQGRGLQWTGQPREKHTPKPEPLPPDTEFWEVERGGDLTWHGPGQLVVYPIVRLDGSGFGSKRDVTGYLRRLERLLIDLLSVYHLKAEAKENATGVWIGHKKIASIGISVRKWVTFHGAALNVVNDLRPFSSFSPCGYPAEVMTSLREIQPADWHYERWREEIEMDLQACLRAEYGAGVGELETMEIDNLLGSLAQ